MAKSRSTMIVDLETFDPASNQPQIAVSMKASRTAKSRTMLVPVDDTYRDLADSFYSRVMGFA